MPPAFVRASGDHFAVGFKMGEQGKDALHNIVFKLPRFKYLKENWGTSEELHDMMHRTQSTFPQYFQEIEGIAAGADAAVEDIFLWNCRGDFPKEKANEIETAGCTDVLLAGKDGKSSTLAHNEDGNVKLKNYCFVVRAHFNKKAKSPDIESYAYPGMLMGHTFAANSHGLVLTINHLPLYNPTKGVPRHFISRAILDCATKEEALEVIRKHGSSGSFNYNIGQVGESTLLSVEAPSGSFKVTEVRDRFTHANHCVWPEHDALRPPVEGSTAHRQRRAEAILPQLTPNEAGAKKLLFDRSDADFPIMRDATGKDKGVATLATAVFRLNRKSVSWKFYGDDPDKAFRSGNFRLKT